MLAFTGSFWHSLCRIEMVFHPQDVVALFFVVFKPRNNLSKKREITKTFTQLMIVKWAYDMTLIISSKSDKSGLFTTITKHVEILL